MNLPLGIPLERKNLQALLAAAAVVLVVIFAWELYSIGRGAGTDAVGGAVSAAGAGKQGKEVSRLPRAKEFYGVVASKDLFSPGRSSAASLVQKPLMGLDSGAADYVLEGVLMLGSRKTAILRKSKGRTGRAQEDALRVKVGETVGQYRVTEIEKDGVTMVSASGEQVWLSLFSIDSGAERRHTKSTQAAPQNPGAFTPQPRPRVPVRQALPAPTPNMPRLRPNR